MKERTATTSISALIAGIMSIITVFGGYTALLGIFFALFGIIIGTRGKREQPTATALWAVRISIFGLILCSLIFGLLFILFLASAIGLEDFGSITERFGDSFHFENLYQTAKDLLLRLINRF